LSGELRVDLGAVRIAVAAGLLDRVELNEVFAPQALACVRDFQEMGIDPEKVNPSGSAVALGYPLGATGAILTPTCAYALRRNKQRHGLVAMCIGGGEGIASGKLGAIQLAVFPCESLRNPSS
jgi:acetyl-CoA acetyltransferase